MSSFASFSNDYYVLVKYNSELNFQYSGDIDLYVELVILQLHQAGSEIRAIKFHKLLITYDTRQDRTLCSEN